MSFSGLNVLISTPSPQKDILLAPTVHEKIANENLKKEVFLDNPLFHVQKPSILGGLGFTHHLVLKNVWTSDKKAGNQEFQSLNVIENFENFQNIENDP